jgi:hypothetical protein
MPVCLGRPVDRPTVGPAVIRTDAARARTRPAREEDDRGDNAQAVDAHYS